MKRKALGIMVVLAVFLIVLPALAVWNSSGNVWKTRPQEGNVAVAGRNGTLEDVGFSLESVSNNIDAVALINATTNGPNQLARLDVNGKLDSANADVSGIYDDFEGYTVDPDIFQDQIDTNAAAIVALQTTNTVFIPKISGDFSVNGDYLLTELGRINTMSYAGETHFEAILASATYDTADLPFPQEGTLVLRSWSDVESTAYAVGAAGQADFVTSITNSILGDYSSFNSRVYLRGLEFLSAENTFVPPSNTVYFQDCKFNADFFDMTTTTVPSNLHFTGCEFLADIYDSTLVTAYPTDSNFTNCYFGTNATMRSLTTNTPVIVFERCWSDSTNVMFSGKSGRSGMPFALKVYNSTVNGGNIFQTENTNESDCWVIASNVTFVGTVDNWECDSSLSEFYYSSNLAYSVTNTAGIISNCTDMAGNPIPDTP